MLHSAMRSLQVIFAAFLLLQAAVADNNVRQQALARKYQFTRQLHSRYTLYWTYDPAIQEASFAVFVQTTGWVGFGLSPTGSMPGSDVVIGWVDDRGNTYFHDRFASERATPAIDEIQNWDLVDSLEENGYITLEFKRNYTSCDRDFDLDIEPNTARVVWSFKEEDPPNGANGRFVAHDFKGSVSLNLLGGNLNLPNISNETDYFELLAEEVTIPSADTTYWCSSFMLPDDVLNQEQYIVKVGPSVSEESSAHVHHLLVYFCTDIIPNPSAAGTQCHMAPTNVSQCLSSKLYAAWAIGGEELVYPANVALPIGGPNFPYKYAVMQLHYDNPNGLSGVVDNSGMRFYYVSEAREHNAGIMEIGYYVVPEMVIPPKVSNYTILGLCPTDCTQNFPDEGITIFANVLHTHLLGVGVEILHLREDEDCDGVRELKPVDKNLRYDFNYQNVVYLDNIVVNKGDILVLRCTYDSLSAQRTGVTLGGEGTYDEMCLSFLQYYPAVGINTCLSLAHIGFAFPTFLDNYVALQDQAPFASLLDGYDNEELASVLNTLEWTDEQIQGLEKTYHSTLQIFTCGHTAQFAAELGLNTTHSTTYGFIPNVTCEYEEPIVVRECPVCSPNVTCDYKEPIVVRECAAGSMQITSFVAIIVLMAVTATMAIAL